MKKKRAVLIGAVIVATIAAGFFFGERLSAAEKRPAFVPDQNSSGYFMALWDGFLEGSTNTLCHFWAPIVFPKYARHILHIDFFVQDGYGGGSATIQVYRSDPSNSSSSTKTAIVDFSTGSYSGALYKYVSTPSDKNIYSSYVYYVVFNTINTAKIYGAIVYYSTT